MVNQSEYELSVFKGFVEVAGLSVAFSTIAKRQPPEPDILCNLNDGEIIAFELVEICNRRNARYPLSAHRYCRMLTDAVEDLGDRDKEIFKARYTGVPLGFCFRDDASENKVRHSANKIIADLLTAEDFEDEFSGFSALASSVLEKVERAGRLNDPNGLNFNFPGRFDPRVPLDAITAKFTKRYVTDHPIELVAHFGGWATPQFEDYKAPLMEIITQIGLGPFRKVWVMERGNIGFVYP